MHPWKFDNFHQNIFQQFNYPKEALFCTTYDKFVKFEFENTNTNRKDQLGLLISIGLVKISPMVSSAVFFFWGSPGGFHFLGGMGGGTTSPGPCLALYMQ